MLPITSRTRWGNKNYLRTLWKYPYETKDEDQSTTNPADVAPCIPASCRRLDLELPEVFVQATRYRFRCEAKNRYSFVSTIGEHHVDTGQVRSSHPDPFDLDTDVEDNERR